MKKIDLINLLEQYDEIKRQLEYFESIKGACEVPLVYFRATTCLLSLAQTTQKMGEWYLDYKKQKRTKRGGKQ